MDACHHFYKGHQRKVGLMQNVDVASLYTITLLVSIPLRVLPFFDPKINVHVQAILNPRQNGFINIYQSQMPDYIRI